MYRLRDFTTALALIFCLLIPFLIIGFFIKLTSKGNVIFWSERVGQNNSLFRMPKFRSMIEETPLIESEKVENPNFYVTKVGRFIRKYSIDELPQLWSVLIGDMSLVGPRPALKDQTELIKLRDLYGISSLKPGLTGWAQINGRDNITTKEKTILDAYYLNKRSFFFDIKILISTPGKILSAKDVSH